MKILTWIINKIAFNLIKEAYEKGYRDGCHFSYKEAMDAFYGKDRHN